MKNKLNAIIYIRISDPKQRGNESLETQLRDCKAYAKRVDAKVVKVFREECESAKTRDRTELINLLEFARENKDKTDILIVWKIDRFARNQVDHFALKATLLSYGVELHSATEPIDNSPIGNAMEGMLAVFAEFDNSVRSARSLANMKTAFRSGRWMWKAPMGYKNEVVDGKKRIIKDPERFDLLTQGLREFNSGLLSVKDLADRFNEWGLKTPEENGISIQFTSKILQEKFYAGLMVAKAWDMEVDGSHEPMITLAEYYQNQAILEGNSGHLRVKRPKHNDLFPLSGGGLLCIECGDLMRHIHPTGYKKRYKYYVCRNKECSKYRKTVDLSADAIHETFIDKLIELVPNDAVIELFKEIVMDKWETEYSALESKNDKVDSELDKLREERKNIYELAKKGLFDAETIKEDLDKVENKITALEVQRNDTRMDKYEIGTVLKYAEIFIRNPYGFWKKATIQNKKVIQNVIFPEGFTYIPELGIQTGGISCIYRVLEELKQPAYSMVTPRGIEPRFTG
jgi:site-specific DNA recombinase